MALMIPFPDISPEIFSINLFGFSFALRWYALAYIVGIIIGWRLVVMTAKTPRLWPGETPVMTPEQMEEMLTWIILGVLLGGRLGYVLFYQPGYYLQNPTEILALWEGGMSFHGGLIGVIIAAFMYVRRHPGVNRFSVADAIALGVPPGLLLGRFANFINAELWGRPTELAWGVAFPGQAAQFCPEVVGICARHPSQLYEAILEGVVLLVVLLWMVWRRGAFKTPGLICGTFLAGYGLARFAVEFVRQPDAQFISPGNPLGLAWHVNGYGLTMGQLLSVPMILLGLWLMRRARRRATAAA
ncbi:MAG: prolipoprotein diacylglyceryl transferase [Pseudomonadota bacterium]